MDVILDTNIILSLLQRGADFRNANAFAELLSYLRRTNGRLIIPGPVLQELEARYRDTIAKHYKELNDAAERFKHASMTHPAVFVPPVSIDGEVSGFRERLLNPGSGVTTHVINDYTGVSHEEIVRRGAHRIRPANDRGEELRDVIIWLVVLAFATTHKQPLAFISNDSGFKGQDEKLHPTLADDIKAKGVNITLHPSIRQFIAANALDAVALSASDAHSLIYTPHITSLLETTLPSSDLNEGSIQRVHATNLTFKNGTKYRVAPNSFFIEVFYTASLELIVLTQSKFTLWGLANAPLTAPAGSSLDLSEHVSDAYFLRYLNHLTAMRNEAAHPRQELAAYTTEVTLAVSARMNDGKVETPEITRLDFGVMKPSSAPQGAEPTVS
jgi:hypothetical protein